MKIDLWLIIPFHIRYVANPIKVLAKIATEGGETPDIVLGKVVAGDAAKLEVLDLVHMNSPLQLETSPLKRE